MHFVLLTLFAVLMTYASSGVAAEKLLYEEKKILGNEECIPKLSCLTVPPIPGLKEVGFWVKERKYHSAIKDDIEGHDAVLYAWYETPTHATLEDFAFVQYVRGCIFSSRLNENGEVSTHFNVVRKHMGERKHYLHLDWEVDAASTDPFFLSNPNFALRHYFMEWTKTPEKFPAGQGSFYGDDPPSNSRLHMRHSAQPFAYVFPIEKNFAINHSLEYRTCLYRADNIPRSGKGIIPGALVCHEWRSSFVYDYKESRYTSPVGIVDACKPPTMPNLKNPW